MGGHHSCYYGEKFQPAQPTGQCYPKAYYGPAHVLPQPCSLDEMSTRIDDLEKNIADLMTQAGVEEIEGVKEPQMKEGQGS